MERRREKKIQKQERSDSARVRRCTERSGMRSEAGSGKYTCTSGWFLLWPRPIVLNYSFGNVLGAGTGGGQTRGRGERIRYRADWLGERWDTPAKACATGSASLIFGRALSPPSRRPGAHTNFRFNPSALLSRDRRAPLLCVLR